MVRRHFLVCCVGAAVVGVRARRACVFPLERPCVRPASEAHLSRARTASRVPGINVVQMSSSEARVLRPGVESAVGVLPLNLATVHGARKRSFVTTRASTSLAFERPARYVDAGADHSDMREYEEGEPVNDEPSQAATGTVNSSLFLFVSMCCMVIAAVKLGSGDPSSDLAQMDGGASEPVNCEDSLDEKARTAVVDGQPHNAWPVPLPLRLGRSAQAAFGNVFRLRVGASAAVTGSLMFGRSLVPLQAPFVATNNARKRRHLSARQETTAEDAAKPGLEKQLPIEKGLVVATTVLCSELIIGLLTALIMTGRLQLSPGFGTRVTGAVLSGAVAAFFAAIITTFCEPVLNRVLVLRIGFREALKGVKLKDSLTYFPTALVTNMGKIPFFEAIYVFFEALSIPVLVRRLLSALVYTTVVLPSVNFRYRRSVGGKVRASNLFEAFRTTLFRDAIYCVVRGLVADRLRLAAPLVGLAANNPIRATFVRMFLSVLIGCIAAAPVNELRAYVLDRRCGGSKSLTGFVNFSRFIRTTVVGSVGLASVVASGYALTSNVKPYWSWFLKPATITAPGFVLLGLSALALVGINMERRYLVRRYLRFAPAFDKYAQLRQLRYVQEAAQEGLREGLIKVKAATQEDKERNEKPAPLEVQILQFVVPACGLVAANQAMTAVDKAFVGRISSMQLAAMGSAATSFDCVSYITTFINTAGLSLLGTARARNDAKELNRLRSHALVFAVTLGALLTLFLTTFSKLVCRVLGGAPPGGMLVAAQAYLGIRALGIPVERAISIGTTFCLAAKDGNTPLRVTVVGSVANVILDYLFCSTFPHERAAAASAAASVVAALISAAYLIRRLRISRLWPSPLAIPGRKDFGPFLSFAGPVFMLLIVKSVIFTQMTAYASGLGSVPAAAHQLYVSLLFLTAVAVGTPLSWAAQSFMPEVLESSECSVDQENETAPVIVRLRSLLKVAVGCALLSSLVALLALRVGISVFTRDVQVITTILRPGTVSSFLAFVFLYPMFLVLEGTLIAARQLRLAVVVTSMLVGCNTVLFGVLLRLGLLNLCTLWGASSASLLVATTASFLVAARACEKATCSSDEDVDDTNL